MTEKPPYKTLIIGDSGVGKSSLVRRYVDNSFKSNYLVTLGVDFSLKSVTVREQQVRLQLWDIAGQERFRAMTRAYFKQAVAAVVVFDVTKRTSFDDIAIWKSDLDSKVSIGVKEDPVPCILLANKCDLPERAVSMAEMQEMQIKHGFIGCCEVSAKLGTNVDKAFTLLIESILARDSDIHTDAMSQPTPSTIPTLHASTQPVKSDSCC